MKRLLTIISAMASFAGCAAPLQFIPFEQEIPSMEVVTNIVDNKLADYVKIDDLKEVHFKEMEVSGLTIDGKKPSLEGHKHSVTDIVDWSEVQLVVPTIEVESITIDGKKPSIEGHKHDAKDIIGLNQMNPYIAKAATNAIEKVNSATNMADLKKALTEFLIQFAK